MWIAAILHFAFYFSLSLSISPSVSLALEQAPESGGTMMSMNSIFVTHGLLIAAAVGGIALVLAGWTGVLVTFAALCIIAAGIHYFLTKDPCRP
jgi:predicted MFS family arabinose efflux permease